MSIKLFIICGIATYVQKTTSQFIGRLVNNGFSGNAINSYKEKGYGLYGSNLAYPAYGLPYDKIVNGIYGRANTCDNTVFGLSLATLAASKCNEFSVRSSSPIGVNGIFIETDNMVIEGPLSVTGQLPLLGTVAFEGNLPTAGNGGVSYDCGDGDVGILNEEYPSIATPAPSSYSSVIPKPGYGPAVTQQIGCNRINRSGSRGFY